MFIRKNPALSFHKIPKDEALRKKWVKLFKTKGLCNPSDNHLLCSAHFPGGIRTYDNNIPTILDIRKHLKQRRIIVKHVAPVCELSATEETSSADVITIEEEPVEQLTNSNIQEQLDALKEKYQQLEAKYD